MIPSITNTYMPCLPGRSALEEEHGNLACIVHVESGLCLARHFEGEALPHHAVPAGTELTIHAVLHELACKLYVAVNTPHDEASVSLPQR